MDDADAPLLDAWQRFVRADVTPFTIPGHKRRAEGIWPTLGRLLESDVPLFGGLDTIKQAPAALAEAQWRGAQLWDADWCRYSTGGSTHVNQVAALAVGRPGQPVLVARSAHRSTLSGLILAGLDPVWLPAAIDDRLGLPVGLSLPALEVALGEHPDAAAVFCVEPSYVGTVSDLPGVVAAAHARDVPVVVDQAWGAHFGFTPDYPQHALQAGADMLITSAHKTLPAYSQAALLLARTGRLDPGRLDRAFDLSFTTSPAGSILASIDAARALLSAPLGRDRLTALAGQVTTARARLRAAGYTVPGPDDFAPGRFDPAKLVVLLDGNGNGNGNGNGDGNAIEQALLAQGVPVEQADRHMIVALVTLADDQRTLDRLCTTLAAVGPVPSRRRIMPSVWTTDIAPVACSPRAAFFAPHDVVPAEHAVGRISAETIAPYPPGIAVLVPGEIITAATISALEAARDAGTRIAYARDPTLRSYTVVVE